MRGNMCSELRRNGKQEWIILRRLGQFLSFKRLSRTPVYFVISIEASPSRWGGLVSAAAFQSEPTSSHSEYELHPQLDLSGGVSGVGPSKGARQLVVAGIFLHTGRDESLDESASPRNQPVP